MTTVGYGDIPVTTDAGRLIGLFVMVVGIGFGTLVIGAVSQRFFETEAREEIAEHVRAADVDVLRELEAIRNRVVALEATIRRARPKGSRGRRNAAA
jgi:voltage-gated potassium channel Kch